MINARESTNRLALLLRSEHGAMADFLVALADFDRRKLWVELGYSGLFAFLHRELGLSKASAFYRKTAAELLQRFPEIEAPLRDGRLCITAVVELAKVMTPENREEVLPRFFHCSKREAKAVSAAIAPEEAPPRRDVVTSVWVAPATTAPGRAASPAVVRPSEVRLDEPTQSQIVIPAAPATAAPGAALPARAAPDEVEPLTAELRRLHVTVSRRFLEKLAAAKAALSHTHPGGSAGEILEAGLDLLLERDAKRKGIVKKPLAKPRPSAPDRFAAHVSRELWQRDGGRCQWPLESGGVCGSTVRVERDHVTPRAEGGPSTVENGRILCRFHNNLAARQAFGDDHMDRFTRRAGARVDDDSSRRDEATPAADARRGMSAPRLGPSP